MTVSRLDDISKEVSEIGRRLSFLDPANIFESKTRELLLNRLSDLKTELKRSILEAKKQNIGLRLI